MSMASSKKYLMVLVALVTVFSFVLTGCGGAKKAAEPVVSATPVAVEETPTPTPLGPPVEITLQGFVFIDNFPAGFQDDPVMKEIEKKLNIHLNLIPANGIGDPAAKFAAQLASGDLPDISLVGPDFLPKVISAGAALPLDDLVQEYGQDIVKNTPFRIEYAKKYLSKDNNGVSDNKLYFIKLGGDFEFDPLNAQVAPFLRFDLYKQLGYPKLVTMDDYIPVLKQMMELEPKNAEGKKTYGVAAWFAEPGWGQWGMQVPFCYFKGIQCQNPGNYDIDMVTYNVTNRLTNPTSTFWEGIEWFNKANVAGVLDPASFTLKWGDYVNATTANTVFLGWANWNISGGDKTFGAAGHPEKGFYQMPSPNTGDQTIMSVSVPQGNAAAMISKSSKHPEKAMELLNFLMSYEGTQLLFNGIEGTHYDVVDGKPVVRPEVSKGLKDDPKYSVNSGVRKYSQMSGRGAAVLDPKYNLPLDFMYFPENVVGRLTEIHKIGNEHFGVTLPFDLYKDKKHLTFDASIEAALPAVVPDDIAAIQTLVSNYIATAQIKMVTYKDEKKFAAEKAKFISDITNMGYDKVISYYKTEVDKILADRKK